VSRAMGFPVVHFEINSGAASELQRFYARAFGWSVDTDDEDGYGDVRTEGVCPGSGFPGIDGGIGPSDGGDDFVTFYVQVPDVAAALEAVVALGGERVFGPIEAGNVVLGMFRDPRGNRIGLVRAEPLS
jgi:predicted enzyme related to lactoylglutathione lyase